MELEFGIAIHLVASLLVFGNKSKVCFTDNCRISSQCTGRGHYPSTARYK